MLLSSAIALGIVIISIKGDKNQHSLIQKIENDDPYPIIVVFESSFHFCIIVLQKAEPFA